MPSKKKKKSSRCHKYNIIYYIQRDKIIAKYSYYNVNKTKLL